MKENWRDDTAGLQQNWRTVEPPKEEPDDWRRTDQRAGNITEEEHYAGEGYQADREDSSRQNSVERPDAHPATDIAQ